MRSSDVFARTREVECEEGVCGVEGGTAKEDSGWECRDDHFDAVDRACADPVPSDVRSVGGIGGREGWLGGRGGEQRIGGEEMEICGESLDVW